MDRVTLHSLCDTKHDPIDDLVAYLSKLKIYKHILERSVLVLLGV